MVTATLQWRTQHAGLKLADLNKTLDRMVKLAKQVKDLNGDGEVQATELKAVTKNVSGKLAKTMESIRSGSGFYARDAQPGGNPVFSHNEFVDDFRVMKDVFKSLDQNKDRQLDAKELKGANSKMRQALVELVASGASHTQP